MRVEAEGEAERKLMVKQRGSLRVEAEGKAERRLMVKQRGRLRGG